MKNFVVALTQLALAALVAHTMACSTAQPKKSAATDKPLRAADIKELQALLAQGPLYFETDTDVLTEPSQRLLVNIAAQMHRVPNVRVVIGGHADERGDTSYNLALGERRAQSAREYLMKLGVPKQRVRIVSLGEEQPIALGHEEGAWSQNRRDEFTFMMPGEQKSVLNLSAESAEGELVASTSWGD